MRRTLPLLFVAAASSLPVGVGGGVINVSKMPHRKPGNTYTQARRHHTHAGARAHAHDLCCACTRAPARVLVARHLSLRAPRWRPRTRRRPLARSRRLMPSGTAPPCDADARVHARHILAGAGRYGSAHTPWCQRRDSTAPAGGIAPFTHSSHPARRAAAKPGAALRRLHVQGQAPARARGRVLVPTRRPALPTRSSRVSTQSHPATNLEPEPQNWIS